MRRKTLAGRALRRVIAEANRDWSNRELEQIAARYADK